MSPAPKVLASVPTCDPAREHVRVSPTSTAEAAGFCLRDRAVRRLASIVEALSGSLRSPCCSPKSQTPLLMPAAYKAHVPLLKCPTDFQKMSDFGILPVVYEMYLENSPTPLFLRCY